MSITLTEAEEMLTLYITAEKAVLKGQAYSIGDRSLTRADLRWIAEERRKWETKVEQLSSSRTGPTVKRILPRDD